MAARFPDARRLVRLDAWSPDFFDEESAACQRGVPDHLAVHAKSRAARQQPVLRIFFDQLRRGSCRLLVRSRKNDLPIKALHIPIVIAKIDSQPVKKLGMAWKRSHQTKV